MAAHCQVELDIFSGMPNPTWTLSNADADAFVRQIAALTRSPAQALAGNLGYRGFIVQCVQDGGAQVVRVQAGVVQIDEGAERAFARDPMRTLERWLLETGKTHIKPEIYDVAERTLR